MTYQPSMSYESAATAPQTATTPPQTAADVAAISQSLLKDCLRKAREWEDLLPRNGVESRTAIQLRILVENLLGRGNPSIISMCKVRTLLCRNCRQLHAAHEQCDGKLLEPLDRCLLLKELH